MFHRSKWSVLSSEFLDQPLPASVQLVGAQALCFLTEPMGSLVSEVVSSGFQGQSRYYLRGNFVVEFLQFCSKLFSFLVFGSLDSFDNFMLCRPIG